jgi:hypothetical protein
MFVFSERQSKRILAGIMSLGIALGAVNLMSLLLRVA